MTGACTTCGEPLPADARYCANCGRPVSGPVVEPQRRVVTIVFADLADFTAFSEGRDPESVKELLDACFGALVPVVTAHGGHVDKIIGDELMAVFGAPVAHEDDPERAVRAALALPEALRTIDPKLVLRVGVNSGEVLAGPVGPGHGYTVTGDVVNTAHRLASVAAPGEILVGEPTHAATADVVAFGERQQLSLRGKAAPVSAWRALEVTSSPSHRWAAGLTRRLVGRTQEIADLSSTAERAIVTSKPVVVVLTGEPGVGKKRLALELGSAPALARHGTRVLWASCPPYGKSNALGPLVDLIRAGLLIDPTATTATQMQRLTSRLAALRIPAGTDATLLVARTAQLLGLSELPARPADADGGPTRARVLDQLLSTVRSLFEALAEEQPLLVVIDDLQWASDAVVAFLRRLPQRIGPSPLAVLAVARDDVLERSPALALGGVGLSMARLQPLDRASAIELIGNLLADEGRRGDAARPDVAGNGRSTAEGAGPTGPASAGPTGPAGVAPTGPTGAGRSGPDETPRLGPGAEGRILDAAGGNPLLLEQLVHYLIEVGSLVRNDDRWTAAPGFEGAGLPDGVRGLIGARLDALPDVERDALQHASVAGRRFWREAVTFLRGPEGTEEALDRLLERDLVVRLDPHDALGELAFRHVLTRDVAYAALPIGERAHRHARLAAWLRERFAGADTGPAIGLLAHHYERAVVLSREIDHTDAGLTGAAFTALVRAARDAVRHDTFRDAERWFARARDLGSFDVVATLEVSLEHGQVLLGLRRLESATATFSLVQRQAAEVRPDLSARASAYLGTIARLSGDTDLAREHFEEAHARWRELGDERGEVDTLRLEGWSEVTAGRPRAALPRLLRALALEERLGDDRLGGELLSTLGWCEFLAGDIGAARRHLWEAATRLGASGDFGEVGWCFGILGFTALHTGQAARGLEIARGLRATTRAQGDPWSEWTCAVLEGACLLSLGHAEEGLALATAAHRTFEELGDSWGLAMSQLVRGMAHRALGDLPAARARLLEGLATAEQVVYVGEEARLLAELAGVEADAGHRDEATRRGRAALALVRAGIGDHESGVRAMTTLAELERQAGDLSSAELLLEEALEGVTVDDRTDAWRQAAATLAELLVERGDVARARSMLDDAEHPPSDGIRTRMRLASARRALLMAEGRRTEAEAVLAAVTADIDARQAHPLAFLPDEH